MHSSRRDCSGIGRSTSSRRSPTMLLQRTADSARQSRRRSTMHMYPISGAAARVPEDATAFAYRNGGWVGVFTGIDPDPANLPAAAAWAQQYWQEVHPTSAGG